MSARAIPSARRTAIGVGLFGALTVLSIIAFLRLFAPAPHRTPPQPFTNYDPAAMDAALAPAPVRAELDTILGFGSRFLGQEGFERTQAHIEHAFAEAGLEVLKLPVQTAVPATERREVLNAGGDSMPNVDVYPFWPNHLQPMVTPDEGLSGELVVMTDAVLLERASFDDCIAVVDLAEPPRAYEASWIRYAELGCRAVIVTHREGLEAIPWHETGGLFETMVANSPVNVVRLAATRGILDHAGERVTLHVRTAWRQTPHTILVGILRGEAANTEAVVVTASSEACSILPDLAPGVLGASEPAVMMAALRGLLPYRGQLKRDVVFVSYGSRVMGHLPADRLAAVLGPAITRTEGRVAIEQRLADNRRQADAVGSALACFDEAAFLDAPEATEQRLAALTAEARAVFEEEVRYVLNTLVLERSETRMRRRVVFENEGGEDLRSPAFKAYRAASDAYDEALDAAGYPPAKLCAKKASFVRDNAIRDRCLERFRELADFHDRRGLRLERAVAVNAALRRYERLTVFSPGLLPSAAETVGEAFSFSMENYAESLQYRQSPIMNDVMQGAVRRMGLPPEARFQDLRAENHHGWVAQQTANLPLDVRYWNAKGYPAFTLVHTDRKRSYEAIGAPVERPYMRDTGSMRHALRAYGRTLLALAFGDGDFEPPLKNTRESLDYGGRLFVGNVGRSIVPNYPLKHGLMGHKGERNAYKQRGFYVYPVFFTDVYGRYDLPFCGVPIAAPTEGLGYSPEAVGYGPDGLIRLIKDEGPGGQRQYKSMQLGWGAGRGNVNIVLFRGSPITILDMINPQTLKAYAAAGFLTQEGLTPPEKFNQFGTALDGIWTTFLPPDQRYFITLKAGAMGNELVQTTRAFMLGADAAFEPNPNREIDGRGFLPLTDTIVRDVPRRIARSMLQVNGKRLALQTRYHMADERTQRFHARSDDLLADSRREGLPHHEQTLLARDAVTYATLNHPVLRESISEAVFGILWYLGLLVPFVFFFEKLAFGFPDIRKQLAAQAVIFVVVFALLRVLHPAFQMISSSLMILLGFVIMLIAGGITILFSGKFQENLEELKKRRGQVTAAEVNTMGVIGTAFALGLNNMHRRAVRTGLTCATLVLITFAMICFTSVQSDIVETERAVGKAAYPGILVKPEKFKPITAPEIFALESRYGHRYNVSSRSMMVGRQEWNRVSYNPVIEIGYRPADEPARAVSAGSILNLDPDEPLRGGIRLLTGRGWFPDERVARSGEPRPVMLSAAMAGELNIRPERVDREDVIISINGERARVHGLFEADSLRELRDLDGRDLLPFDMTAIRTIEGDNPWLPLADETTPRLPAERIVLAHELQVAAEHGAMRTVSVAVAMPELRYEAARAEVDTYLEQSGQPAFYALGDIAYWGQRVRKRTVAGIVELLVPLLIASMTVLNTMRGSVYERRDEIFVYNAVGIAPKYIFWMFLTEAFVYAVVGSVLGYLLSQGTGRVLTALDLTGGLNMTFTTSATIYTSLAITAAVFLSTVFPARAALRIAAPAEESGWDLPEPDGDVLAFALPFTFGARDRVAVLAFFNRFFRDHGEGSAGRFFAADPRVGVAAERDAAADGGPVPELTTTIWLKPFDLGVSQRLTITLPTDPETGEFIARLSLARLSGTRESWMRLNQGFITVLRQYFLYWRAIGPDDRRRLFDEARDLIMESNRHGA